MNKNQSDEIILAMNNALKSLKEDSEAKDKKFDELMNKFDKLSKLIMFLFPHQQPVDDDHHQQQIFEDPKQIFEDPPKPVDTNPIDNDNEKKQTFEFASKKKRKRNFFLEEEEDFKLVPSLTAEEKKDINKEKREFKKESFHILYKKIIHLINPRNEKIQLSKLNLQAKIKSHLGWHKTEYMAQFDLNDLEELDFFNQFLNFLKKMNFVTIKNKMVTFLSQ